jgi:hypothetical protein
MNFNFVLAVDWVPILTPKLKLFSFMRSALQFVFYPFIILSTALVVLLGISQSPFLFERLILGFLAWRS